MSDLGGKALDDYVAKLGVLGQTTARTTSEMLDATTSFRKNGFNDEDAAQLGQIATMYQNISDESISAAESANMIISQLIAFDIQAEDAISIIDQINEVSNNFSISSGDLAKNIGYVASSSSAMGNNLSETISLLTGITEITKNASRASRSLNSVMASLAQVLDANSSNGKKITAIFEGLGLQMYDTNGQLKSGYNLLKELASVWDTLDGNTQKYIATTIGGTTQLNALIAVLGNFDHVVQANEVALNSAGSAARENARAMESLELKANAVKSTFQQLSASVVDNGLVKAVLDLANAFLRLANTPVGTFVTQVTLLTGVLWGGTGLINAMKLLPAYLNKSAIAMKLFGTAIKFGAPQLTLLAAGLALIIKFAPDVVDWFKKMTDEAYESEANIKDYNEQLRVNKERLEEISRIPIKNRTDAINDEEEALRNQNATLKSNIALEERKLKLTNVSRTIEGPREQGVSGFYIQNTPQPGAEGLPAERISDINGALVFVKDAEQALEKLVELSFYSEEQVKVALDKANGNAIEALASLGKTLEAGFGDISNEEYYKRAFEDLAESATFFRENGKMTPDFIDSYVKSNDVISEFLRLVDGLTDDELISLGMDWAVSMREAAEELQEGNKEVADSYYTVTETLLDLSEGMEVNSLQYDQLLDKYPNLAEALSKTAQGYEANGSALTEMLGQMTSLEAMTEELATVYQKLISGMAVSQQEVVALTNKYPALLSMIHRTKDGYYLEIQALADSANADAEWARAMILNQGKVTEQTIAQIQVRIKNMIAEAQALRAQAEAHGGAGAGMDAKYTSAIGALQSQLRALQSLGVDDSVVGGVGGGGGSAGGGSGSSQKEEDPIAKRNKELEEEKKKYEQLFAVIEKKAQEEIDVLEEQKNAVNERYDAEIEALQKENDELEEQKRLQEALDELARAKQRRVLVYKDGKFQYANDVDAVSEAQSNVDEVTREQQLKDQIEALEASRDAEIKAIDEKIAYWEKLKEEWSSASDAYQEEQDKLIAEQILGTELEGENWEKRLGNLQEYVDRYKAILAELNANKNIEAGKAPVEMSAEDKARLEELGRMWNEAKTQEEKDRIHAEAEAIRAKYGYSGGAAGDEYIPRHASGTLSARGGMSLVGENGPELRVLGSGDGILPAEITKNLWSWGSITPATLLQSLSSGIGQSVGITIENFAPNLPNVANGEDFANYMRNNFWRQTLQFAKG